MHERNNCKLGMLDAFQIVGTVREHGQDGLVREMQQRGIDVAQFEFPYLFDALRVSRYATIVGNGDVAKKILVQNHDIIRKDTRDFRILREFLGDALVPVGGGDQWYERRRLLMPAFNHQKVLEFTANIADETHKVFDTYIEEGRDIPLNHEYTQITLRVISDFLFNYDISEEAPQISEDISIIARYFSNRVQRLGFPPRNMPLKSNKVFEEALERTQKTIDKIISRHKENNPELDDGSFLSILLSAKDVDQTPLTDREVREEALSMMIAGHETTANTLTWTTAFLSEHPDIQDRIRTELQEASNGEPLNIGHIKNSKTLSRAINETLRLRPPVWIFTRKNSEEIRLEEHNITIPKKSFIAFSPYIMHRNPKFWREPEAFNPDRFDPQDQDLGVKRSFYPFGVGQRRCIGADLAVTETQVILANLIAKARLEVKNPSQPDLLITLRPQDDLVANFRKIKSNEENAALSVTSVQV